MVNKFFMICNHIAFVEINVILQKVPLHKILSLGELLITDDLITVEMNDLASHCVLHKKQLFYALTVGKATDIFIPS